MSSGRFEQCWFARWSSDRSTIFVLVSKEHLLIEIGKIYAGGEGCLPVKTKAMNRDWFIAGLLDAVVKTVR